MNILKNKWLFALTAILAPCAATAVHASVITFAAFSDTAANQWTYANGSLTASTVTANFISYGPPNQLLNYTGPLTYSVRATEAGAAVNNAGVVSQPMNGEITFKNGTVTVLDVIFAGALIIGNAGSNSAGFQADTQIAGNIISYSADSSVHSGTFIAPLSFSIAFTQIPGLAISGSNLTNFTTTASGTFAADSGSGAGSPEPSSLALLSVAGLSLLRRRRRAV